MKSLNKKIIKKSHTTLWSVMKSPNKKKKPNEEEYFELLKIGGFISNKNMVRQYEW